MDYERRDIDLWMQKTLNNWAERGTLSSERSTQMHMMITRLAQQERKKRIIGKACGWVTAIITFIWLLFASCPVAAASYAGSQIHSSYSSKVKVVSLLVILVCFYMKHKIQSNTTSTGIEV